MPHRTPARQTCTRPQLADPVERAVGEVEVEVEEVVDMGVLLH